MFEEGVDFVMRIRGAAVDPAWGVRNFGQVKTHNGVAFSGALTRNGEVVGEFENHGNGGATFVTFIPHGADVVPVAIAVWHPREEFLREAGRLFPGEPEADGLLVLALLERAGL